ncbi:hypothetical protein CAOG_06712 [Capsaspora owczarzaki ATCC 30864]|uniref:DUF4394 domain-containing protein n=1 Tax=Capsaspora owczarzaki (strain ATCC 30864) TaxID=595528 RepID=A0A0D2VXJ0_CAPO3|nr:hypothetical protein CAOG_06712 [Capsaspora owczarzaki ATCC 30864]KJE96377.1 hypothetical protein CAOG_006712 [Capsaspora owczarzaki ATCC 30864]|eukprot:XP_004344333.1 hypothetical protein CAOG_06712 [Capsaspora owczarzaki ATCC 30864]
MATCRSCSALMLAAVSCMIAAITLGTGATFAAALRPPSGLYGIGANFNLVRIDPKTGNITTVGPAVPFLQSQQLAAVDPVSSIFYAVGQNATGQVVIGLDMNTGLVVSQTPLPFVSSMFIGVGQVFDFDPLTNRLIAMGREAGNSTHFILSINPITGVTSNVALIPSTTSTDLLGGSSGFDPSAGIQWVELDVSNNGTLETDLFAVNLTTGQIAHQIPDKYNVNSMAFDQGTNSMLCFTFDDASTTRQLMSLDSATGALKKIGTVKDYTYTNGDIVAFDSEKRILYGIFTKQSGAPATTLFLVGVHPETAAVVSSVQLCQDPASCLWAMVYLP